MRAVSRQERKGRKGLQGEQQGSGSDVLRSSWRAWREAVNPNPRSDSHAKNAKGAKNCNERNRVLDLTFVGPLGALCVMDAPTFTAEDAERAERDRITVASHLVCDVDVRRPRIWNDVEPERRRQAPTLHPAFLRVLCVMDAPTFTAEDAERAQKDRFWILYSPPWRSWRPLRDACRLTPRAQRSQRTAREEQGSGSDVFRPSWRSWRAWRDAVNPTPRSDSHAKSAKGAKNCNGRNRVRDLMFFGSLGVLGALGVMRSVQTLAVTLTPRAQRAQRRTRHCSVGACLRRWRVGKQRRARTSEPS
jgi:hypothetical protein